MDMKTTTAKSDNKIIIKFVVVMVILYIVFSQGNLFMNSVMSPGGRYYNAFIESNLNYIQALRICLIKPAVWVIELFGYQALHNSTNVLVVTGPNLNINYSCLGLGMMSFILAFVIAFPVSNKTKPRIILITFLIVYFLNILRIAGLGILMTSFQSQRRYFDYHHEIFNVFIYLVIFYVLFRWVKRSAENGELK